MNQEEFNKICHGLHRSKEVIILMVTNFCLSKLNTIVSIISSINTYRNKRGMTLNQNLLNYLSGQRGGSDPVGSEYFYRIRQGFCRIPFDRNPVRNSTERDEIRIGSGRISSRSAELR
jgi:hypothetical protein